jgi:hypothetical protein
MRISSVFGLVIALAMFLFSPHARALTIDDFASSSAQQVNVDPGETLSAGFSASTAIGGARVIGASSTTGFLRGRVFEGRYSHSQDEGSSGSTSILWHGQLGQAVVSNGLGSVDLRADGSTAFRLTVKSFDFGFDRPISGTITVYDATDVAGATLGTVSFTLAEEILTPKEILIPFSAVSSQDILGRTGAIKLELFGSDAALDVSIDFFGTTCALFSSAGSQLGTVDQCGVCGGDNSSCQDCLGVPNGTSLPGTGCPTGQAGQCAPGNFNQSCACVPVTPPSTEQCDSIDNDCDGVVDNGAGTCTDCAGVLGGTAVLDRCGICAGDGLSCLGCSTKDLTPLLTTLDGGAKRQEALIRKILKNTDVRASTKLKRQIDKIRTDAHSLQIKNWTIIWTVPVQSTVCENRQFCVTSSNQSIISEYRVHSQELRALGQKAIALRKRLVTTTRKLADRFTFDNEELHAQNMALLATVPTEQFSCS